MTGLMAEFLQEVELEIVLNEKCIGKAGNALDTICLYGGEVTVVNENITQPGKGPCLNDGGGGIYRVDKPHKYYEIIGVIRIDHENPECGFRPHAAPR